MTTLPGHAAAHLARLAQGRSARRLPPRISTTSVYANPSCSIVCARDMPDDASAKPGSRVPAQRLGRESSAGWDDEECDCGCWRGLCAGVDSAGCGDQQLQSGNDPRPGCPMLVSAG